MEQNSLYIPWLRAQVIWLHENTPSGGMVLLYNITISVKLVPGTACKDFPFPFTSPIFKTIISYSLLFLLNDLASYFPEKKRSNAKETHGSPPCISPLPCSIMDEQCELICVQPLIWPFHHSSCSVIPLFHLSHKMSHLCTNIVTFPSQENPFCPHSLL